MTRSSSLAASKRTISLQPVPAWTAILVLAFVTIVSIVGGFGSILRLLFPLGSLAIGVLLYKRYPNLYLGFTWWVWFLIALIRRLIDYRSGWDQQGLILISPYLVTGITFVTLVQYLPKSYRMGGLPFILGIVGIFYGALIGLVNATPIGVFRALLDWISPVLFGFHLFANWRYYPQFKQNFQTVFSWGLLFTGIYGVVQYLVAPEWDRFWMINAKMASIGSPQPLAIRVFSTMHSPGVACHFMMAALLILFSYQGALRIPCSVFGYLTFLLTMVRSAWGGWLVGLLSLIGALKPKLQIRLVITILVMALCVVPLTTIEPFGTIIHERMQSFTNLEKDSSFNARSSIYDRDLSVALSNILGNGIGSSVFINEKGKLEAIVFDSGILDMFFTLGWFGAILHLSGLLLMLFKLFQMSESRFDTFAAATQAVSFGLFAQMPLGSINLGLPGLVMWSCIGMSLAANKYYQHQQALVATQQSANYPSKQAST